MPIRVSLGKLDSAGHPLPTAVSLVSDNRLPEEDVHLKHLPHYAAHRLYQCTEFEQLQFVYFSDFPRLYYIFISFTCLSDFYRFSCIA